jgi:hypothetical protein
MMVGATISVARSLQHACDGWGYHFSRSILAACLRKAELIIDCHGYWISIYGAAPSKAKIALRAANFENMKIPWLVGRIGVTLCPAVKHSEDEWASIWMASSTIVDKGRPTDSQGEQFRRRQRPWNQLIHMRVNRSRCREHAVKSFPWRYWHTVDQRGAKG